MTPKTNSASTVTVAEITGAHGVKGLVRLRVDADDVSLVERSDTLPLTLKNRHKGAIWLASVDGINNRDAAQALKGTQITIARAKLPEPEEAGSYYYKDLEGLDAFDPDGASIGTVIGVHNFGAGDLLEIRPAQGESFYLSFTDKTVPDLNLKTRRITVIIPEMV